MMMKFCYLLIFLFISCTPKPRILPASITLINNHHSVKFSGLDPAIIGELGRDSITGAWETLLPVYRMPADTDLKDYQPLKHGKYVIKDSAIIFTPDTPFTAGKTYFMRYYHFAGVNDVWSFMKQKRKLGNSGYTDLIFK